MGDDELSSLADASARSGLSAAHLRPLAERRDIEARKIGRNWVTTEQAVQDYLANLQKRSKDPFKRQRRLTS